MTDRLANYEPVQARIQRFWEKYPDGRIRTTMVENDDQHVIAYAQVWTYIGNPEPSVDGWAQEVHDGSPVNRQGWMLENAETSAIGRALGNLGFSGHGNTKPTQEDMERVEHRTARQIADDHLAVAVAEAGRYTFKRLKDLAGTPTSAALKQWAGDHPLSEMELVSNPEWRAQVDQELIRLTQETPSDLGL